MSEVQQRLLAGTVAVAAEAIDMVMAMPAALIVAIFDGLGWCKRERDGQTATRTSRESQADHVTSYARTNPM